MTGEEVFKAGEKLCLIDEKLECAPMDAKLLNASVELLNKLDKSEFGSRMLAVTISLPAKDFIVVGVVVMLADGDLVNMCIGVDV